MSTWYLAVDWLGGGGTTYTTLTGCSYGWELHLLIATIVLFKAAGGN